MIEQSADPNRNLTMFTGHGEIGAQEFISAIDAFYSEAVTTNVIWDLRDAELVNLSPESVREVAGSVLGHSEKRPSGRTALVVSEAVAFGLSRMYEILTDDVNERKGVETQVFYEMEKALEWLEAPGNGERSTKRPVRLD